MRETRLKYAKNLKKFKPEGWEEHPYYLEFKDELEEEDKPKSKGRK